MRLLFITQVLDKNDSVLGAYHGWILSLAEQFESIEVICLFEGEHSLPKNVHVHSLGKEKLTRSSYIYALRCIRLVWSLRNSYDRVFVHMNQEYILLCGVLWRALGKRIYFWRNHYAGSFFTDIAASFCTKIFCTSEYSYTAKYPQTVYMPVGIDTALFKERPLVERVPRSILFLARMAPSKRPEMLVRALELLSEQDIQFTASFVGSPREEDREWFARLKEQVANSSFASSVSCTSAVPNSETPELFQSHQVFVNCSPSGMFDKTLFEASAAGATVLASSKDFALLCEGTYFDSAEALAQLLIEAFAGKVQKLPPSTQTTHNQENLIEALTKEIYTTARPIRSFVWSMLFVCARVIPRAPRMTVLLYHSISNNKDFFAVSPLTFDRQMSQVKKYGEAVPLSRAFAHARGDRVARDSVAITFDDGYEDFVTHALPVLEHHRIPATVFVLGDTPDRAELGNAIPLLGANSMNALHNPLITVGSHSLTHRKLTRLSPGELRIELAESLHSLSPYVRDGETYLAYPKGSYNRAVMDASREAGYDGAVSVVEHSVRAHDPLYALPRIQIDGSTSFSEFNMKLTLAIDWYYKLWRTVTKLHV